MRSFGSGVAKLALLQLPVVVLAGLGAIGFAAGVQVGGSAPSASSPPPHAPATLRPPTPPPPTSSAVWDVPAGLVELPRADASEPKRVLVPGCAAEHFQAASAIAEKDLWENAFDPALYEWWSRPIAPSLCRSPAMASSLDAWSACAVRELTTALATRPALDYHLEKVADVVWASESDGCAPAPLPPPRRLTFQALRPFEVGNFDRLASDLWQRAQGQHGLATLLEGLRGHPCTARKAVS